MPVNHAAENVLGTIGTICWTIQVIPQVIKSYREKSTEGLSAWLMFLWAFSGLFLGVYVVVRDINIPLILQPELFTALAALSWAQCLYYGQKKSKLLVALSYLSFMSLFAGIQVGLVFAFRASPNERALQAFGILSAVIISLGLVPQYVEIWKRKELMRGPTGISMLFMAVDMGGGLFSCLSLVFKPKFDGVAAATYLAVVILDGVIVIAALILNPRAKKRRERQVSDPETLGSIPPKPAEKDTQTTATHLPVEP
ncbi:hypothetical protein FRB90_010467 [Tulasnella sp. 427]|nr:hypothetical protein FRB90_010467 [Tulasnella sp. 427]